MEVRELIRAKIKERGLSMATISRGGGRNHAYLQQYLERNLPRYLPDDFRAHLARSLGIPEQQLQEGNIKVADNSTIPGPKMDRMEPTEPSIRPEKRVTNVYSDGLLKVLGMSECGPDGVALWNGEVVDWVPRPPNLSGAKDAYAVFIMGDSMENRYHPGEVAFIHPGKPVSPGAYVLVQKRPKVAGDTPLAMIKRLVKRSGDKVILEQLNPPKTITLLAADIVSMHRVVGSVEA